MAASPGHRADSEDHWHLLYNPFTKTINVDEYEPQWTTLVSWRYQRLMDLGHFQTTHSSCSGQSRSTLHCSSITSLQMHATTVRTNEHFSPGSAWLSTSRLSLSPSSSTFISRINQPLWSKDCPVLLVGSSGCCPWLVSLRASAST